MTFWEALDASVAFRLVVVAVVIGLVALLGYVALAVRAWRGR